MWIKLAGGQGQIALGRFKAIVNARKLRGLDDLFAFATNDAIYFLGVGFESQSQLMVNDLHDA